ncbi:hypothetical protein DYB32_006299 [Aphanomyces invadans]|uniref:Cilia- and flagella-associated protein 299 n=1 Tax=Aphanomyces invadans TaxID=157072 RepID=A0A3R7A712_9STRA|nr:hypothetical protein DYB32_006299 [Aphanomyces invadans]
MTDHDPQNDFQFSNESLDKYATYEDYLDSQISETDIFYLEDEELARQLVELGYRGTGETLRREDFDARKKMERERNAQKTNLPKQLASAGKDFSQFAFLSALASREEMVRNGKLTVRRVSSASCCDGLTAEQSIIFIRDHNSKGQEVSGYIDYALRLKSEAFEPYFERKKRLLPKPSDLSYYNWETQTCTSNSSPNFQVIADSETGLLFKNKRDRKVINVDPKANPGDNSTRTEIKTNEYMQVVIYDHMTRRKN